MPRYAPNKMPLAVKRRYFELIRTGLSGSEAAKRVGVSLSCGSLWFIDAGRVSFIESAISPRYLSQGDRIEIADGLAHGEPVKQIAARIGKSYQSVYREIARNRKADGRYQPWYAHNQAYLRRRRPKPRRLSADAELREVIAGKLARHWSPAQISRWLRRRYRRQPGWQVCTETIYEAVYRGLVVPVNAQNLRTGRTYRHRRGRGRTRDGALKQSTSMKSIHQRALGGRSHRRRGATIGDRHLGGAQVPAHRPGPGPAGSLGPDRGRCADRRVHQAPRQAAPHADLGPGQRDVPPPADRAADGTEDLLRRSALTLAARQQREHQWPAAPILPEGN